MNRTIFDLIKERAVLFDGGMGTELMRHGLPQGACPGDMERRAAGDRPESPRELFRGGIGRRLDQQLRREPDQAGRPWPGRPCPRAERGRGPNRPRGGSGREVRRRKHGTHGQVPPAPGRVHRGGVRRGLRRAGRRAGRGRSRSPDHRDAIRPQGGLGGPEGRPARGPLPARFRHPDLQQVPPGLFHAHGEHRLPAASRPWKRKGPRPWAPTARSTAGTWSGWSGPSGRRRGFPSSPRPMPGSPSFPGDGEVSYSQGLEDYVRFVPAMLEAGANVIGGCCGTDPEHIRKMSEFIHKNKISSAKGEKHEQGRTVSTTSGRPSSTGDKPRPRSWPGRPSARGSTSTRSSTRATSRGSRTSASCGKRANISCPSSSPAPSA